jgi:hypothetical protein
MSSKTKSTIKKLNIHGQPSWRFASDKVEAFLTELGGELGPIAFNLKGKQIQPYSIAPWAEEKEAAELIPILQALRGDFFCMPFGGNATPWRGEKHPVHGDTANMIWHLESISEQAGRVCLHASIETQSRPGRVDKRVFLKTGQTAVYSQHTLTGLKGPMNLGHHPMLHFPDEPGCGVISTSPFLYGQVFPEAFERPENKGYSCLLPGAEFTSLAEVPMANGGKADLTRYPARRGYEDLITLASDPSLPFAWTAVTFPKPRYVWFSLKDPRILRETVFWISNGGRYYAPWSGRHTNVMGLEEVTTYYPYGLAESARPNPLSKKGFPTVLQLSAKQPLVVPYIMAMAAVPAGFGRVKDIVPTRDNQAVQLKSDSGSSVTVPLCLDFLQASAGWP